MSFAQTTIRLSRFFENIHAGVSARRLALVAISTGIAIMMVASLMVLLLAQRAETVFPIAAVLAMTAVIGLMLVRHEWLFLLGVVSGHTLFYGRFPNELGMRYANSLGPAEVMFMLAFIAGMAFWYNNPNRPRVPASLIWGPILAFAYSLVYLSIAYFLWKRQSYMMNQLDGWLQFSIAIVGYLCFTTSRIYKPFFIVMIVSLLASGILSSMTEAQIGGEIIRQMGFGGMTLRSYGTDAVKSSFLPMSLVALAYATVIVGFSKRPIWQYLSILATCSGWLFLFLDRGRIHWAGYFVGLVALLFVIPIRPRLKFLFSMGVAVLFVGLVIQGTGGPLKEKVDNAVSKAAERIALTEGKVVAFDQGLITREREINVAIPYYLSNPLFGDGPGIIFQRFKIGDTTYLATRTWMDSSFWYILSTSGLVGFSLIWLCYLSMTGASIFAMLKLRNPLHKALAFAPVAVFLFVCVCFGVTSWFLDRTYTSAFAISVGLSLSLLYHEKIHGSEKPVVDF